MLQQALFSPGQPWRTSAYPPAYRLLRNRDSATCVSPSFSLASLGSSSHRFHRHTYSLAGDRNDRFQRYVVRWAFVRCGLGRMAHTGTSTAKQAVGRAGAKESPELGRE